MGCVDFLTGKIIQTYIEPKRKRNLNGTNKKHKHENNDKHVTKKPENNKLSSTLIMINFTSKFIFLKF